MRLAAPAPGTTPVRSQLEPLPQVRNNFLELALLTLGVCLAVLVCADGWTKSGQLCYKLETEAVDYATAEVMR